jgi:hypothetical protein
MSQTVSVSLTHNFFPPSQLPVFSRLIDQNLESDLEQLAVFQQALNHPLLWGERLLERTLKRYTKAADVLHCCREQLQRWHNGDLTRHQLDEVEKLEDQVLQTEQCHRRIILLVQYLKGSITKSAASEAITHQSATSARNEA